MSNVLIIEPNTKIAELYALNLYVYVGIESIKIVSTYEEGKANIEEGDVKLVICRNIIDGADIVSSVQSIKGDAKLVVVGGDHYEGEECIISGLNFKSLIKKSATLIGVTARDMVNKVVPNYFPISISYFGELDTINCVVYDQDPGDPENYLKRFDPFDPTFSSNSINIWAKQGATHLYVDKNDRLKLVNLVSGAIIKNIDENTLNEDEKVNADEMGVQYLSAKINQIGVTEETRAMAHKSLANIARRSKKSPMLSKLVAQMLKNKSGYLFKHVQILSYISLHIMKNLDWGNAEQEEKFSYIAFFHDICLTEDHLAKIHSKVDLREANLDADTKRLVEEHAMRAASLVTQFHRIPMGVDIIIKQHHGVMNGIGFSETFGANLSPLAIVFIIAEEFTRILISHPSKDINAAEVYSQLKSKFKMRRFQKVLEAIQGIPM